MLLSPITVSAAVAGCLASLDAGLAVIGKLLTSAQLRAEDHGDDDDDDDSLFDDEGDDSSSIVISISEMTMNKREALGRLSFEAKAARTALRQFDGVLNNLEFVSTPRLGMVSTLQLIAAIGECVFAVDCLLSRLVLDFNLDTDGAPEPRCNDRLDDVLRALQEARTAIWLTTSVLESPNPSTLTDSHDALCDGVAVMLDRGGKMARRLRDTDSMAVLGVTADQSLADVLNPGCVPVPIHAKDLQHSSHYDFLNTAESLLNTTESTPVQSMGKGMNSCHAIFHAPTTTEAHVLQFFHYALNVSNRFGKVWAEPISGPAESYAKRSEKLRELPPKQLRELCIDAYDELVRRNVVDARGEDGHGPPLEVEGFLPTRNWARTKLAGLDDGRFLGLVKDTVAELQRRVEGGEGASRVLPVRSAV